jgi:hypothetical protein
MRKVKPRVAAVTALVIAAVGAVTLQVGASEPSSSAVAVPGKVGQTTTVSWHGTAPASSVHASDCNAVAVGTEDQHLVDVTAPRRGYDGYDAKFTFKITWTPVGVTGGPEGISSSDLVLTVNQNGGADAGDTQGSEVGSSDNVTPTSGTADETVVAYNLATGPYQVLVCGFTNVAGQPYDATLTVETTPKFQGAGVASANAQGLEFGAAVPVDAQRDEAEPIVEIDRAGNIYACGPTGFSNASDYSQVSTDGGDSFHLLGTPPRGQQGTGGGGDCALATGITKNAQGNYQYAYSGLDALNGFTTSTSPDYGHSIASGGPNGNGLPFGTTQGVLADRQWMTFVDDHTVLLSYNQQVPRNVVIQTSTDGGLTYAPTAVVAAPNAEFPGPLRYVEGTSIVYFPYTKGMSVNLAVSNDKGATWTNCNVANGEEFVKGGTAGFAVADHDSAGNVYVAWSDSSAYHAWMSALTAADVAACNEPIAQVKSDPGGIPALHLGSAPVQVDRDKVGTTVFPWVAAGGAPGRVAVTFYGTESDGDPNTNEFNAAWDVYVNQSLNALDPARTFSQVKATTHPFHYDSICLNGLACDTTQPGDRSLADFFAIAYSPVTKKLTVVFDRGNKKPEEAAGHVATTMAATQIAGPSNGGGKVTTGRPVVRTTTDDASSDALSNYSLMGVGAAPPNPGPFNEPAADVTNVSILPDSTTQGFTVKLKVADLSTAAIAQTLARTGGKSILYLFRFTNGYQDVGVSASTTGLTWKYGYDDYTTGSTACENTVAASNEKCQVYPQAQGVNGSVDVATGTITLTVPRSALRQLGPVDGFGRPTEVAAGDGARFYDGTAWTEVNTVSPDQTVQSFLYPLDETAAMDFVLPRSKK